MTDIKFTKTNGKIINYVDISGIQKKATEYENFSKLRADFQWFRHNCQIIYASDNVVLNATKELINYVDEEISSIKKCVQCYLNAYLHPQTSFVMVCENPHPIIWSKTEGCSFWPAKAMSCENGMVHVRYFGDHSTDNVPIENCYKFSANTPDETEISGSDSTSFNKALKVSYSRYCLVLIFLHLFIIYSNYRKPTNTLKTSATKR